MSDIDKLIEEVKRLRDELDRERLGLAVIMSRPHDHPDHPAARAVIERDEARARMMELTSENEELRRERLQVGLRAGFDVGALEAEREELRLTLAADAATKESSHG